VTTDETTDETTGEQQTDAGTPDLDLEPSEHHVEDANHAAGADDGPDDVVEVVEVVEIVAVVDEPSSDEDVAGDATGGDATGGDDSDDDDSDDDDSDDDDSDDDSDTDGEDGEDGEAAGTGRRSGQAARLEREGEIAADFLERLLDIADLDGDLDVDVEGERASVAIVDSSEGRVPRRLVGQNGEVLEALQELTRLAVQARTGDRTRLMLDVAGHRARRREQLVIRAQEAIDEVKQTGEPLRLEAMNPFERKIVHDAVSGAGLASSSEGAEPDRRIVVRPAG
jgi:spoIIIJ-associated protein